MCFIKEVNKLEYEVEKIYSDNPYMDELIYYTKQLALGTILKNEQEALNKETTESLRKADLFMASYEGHAPFELFDRFPAEVLLNAGCEPTFIPSYIRDKNKIPESKRDIVTEKMRLWYVENYEEKNGLHKKAWNVWCCG